MTTDDEALKTKITSARTRAKDQFDEAIRELEQHRTDLRARVDGLRAAESTRSTSVRGGSQTRVLVAEGDSWFDYPFFGDTLDALEDGFGYRIQSAARLGHLLEDMAYNKSQVAGFTRALERGRDQGEVAGILLSAGGNDVAGPLFSAILEHADGPEPRLNEVLLKELVHVRFRVAYEVLVHNVEQACQRVLGRIPPIIIHGYGPAVPDGRGFLGGAWVLPGPWLQPELRKRAYPNGDRRGREFVRRMIQVFNEMLREVGARNTVRYVDLRDIFDVSDHTTVWQDELHPTREAFLAVAQRFDAALSS